MISPAFTTWPPKRLTPRRCAFESRPLREDEAPFLCAMSSALRDVADHDVGEGLTVPLPLVVAGLVLELVDADLRALAVADDLAGHGHARQGLRVAGDGVAVHQEQRGEGDGVARLTGETVDREPVAHGDLVLPSTGLHDCVHHELLDRCLHVLRAHRCGPPVCGTCCPPARQHREVPGPGRSNPTSVPERSAPVDAAPVTYSSPDGRACGTAGRPAPARPSGDGRSRLALRLLRNRDG